MALSTIKIPEKVYVGFQGRRTQDEVPLGYMTPYTDDAAGQKRRDSVDKWAKGWGNQKTFNAVTLENKPMIGFKIGRAIRRSGGWNGSGASYIRIEDPRGFELEITIENLAMCMNENIIDNGEIIAECVWGRDGNRNILLPTNSEPFKNSVQTTAAVSAAIPLKDVKPGDRIKLLTGEEGLYMGGMYAVDSDKYETKQVVRVNQNRRYILIQEKNGETTIDAYASIKVEKIVTAAAQKMTPSEIEKHVATIAAQHGNECFIDHSNGWGRSIYGWVTSKTADIVQSLDKLTENDIRANVAEYKKWRIFGKGKSGIEVNMTPSFTANFVGNRQAQGRGYEYEKRGNGYYSWQTVKVATDGFMGEQVHVHLHGYSTTGDRYNRSKASIHIEEDDLDYFFMIRIEVKSKTGEVITVTM